LVTIGDALLELILRAVWKSRPISWVLVGAETEECATAALEVLKEKMIKRAVSLKHLEIAEPAQSGKVPRIFCAI